jgi:hypothetical protein
VCSLIKFCRVLSSIRVPLDVKTNVENSDHPQNSTRFTRPARHGKRRKKTLIPGPVWYVEKLILTQHCFKPAPAAIGNAP